MIKAYYKLMKPGIILGNAITAIGGFSLASKSLIHPNLFFTTLGISSIIGSACVFNNYIDQDIDRKMTRTKDRALAKGIITGKKAILFAVCLSLLGIFLLASYTNLLTLSIAAFGFFVYVVLYSFLKYRTVYATLIGAVAGSTPAVVGYCSFSNHFDCAAFLLFTIMFLWQMPHFYAISLYRIRDYLNASIPVLPIKEGSYITKIHMMFYIIAFMLAAALLTFFWFTGYGYLACAELLGVIWLILCISGFKKGCNDAVWARKMFIFSLVTIIALFLGITLSSFLSF